MEYKEQPPAPDKKISRVLLVLLQLVCFNIVAVGFAMDGRSFFTVVAVLGAVGAVIQLVYLYWGKRPP